jgi:hypothetical protein
MDEYRVHVARVGYDPSIDQDAGRTRDLGEGLRMGHVDQAVEGPMDDEKVAST